VNISKKQWARGVTAFTERRVPRARWKAEAADKEDLQRRARPNVLTLAHLKWAAYRSFGPSFVEETASRALRRELLAVANFREHDFYELR
jgi:hypothetical protein